MPLLMIRVSDHDALAMKEIIAELGYTATTLQGPGATHSPDPAQPPASKPSRPSAIGCYAHLGASHRWIMQNAPRGRPFRLAEIKDKCAEACKIDPDSVSASFKRLISDGLARRVHIGTYELLQ